MTKFWIELSSEICLRLERAAVEAKAQGRFPPKRYGKKAMVEFLVTEWANGRLVLRIKPKREPDKSSLGRSSKA